MTYDQLIIHNTTTSINIHRITTYAPVTDEWSGKLIINNPDQSPFAYLAT